MPTSNRYRIGFDIGGTFTDFILLDTQRNEIRLHKCLTTPHDPSVGALEGLTELLHAARLTLADIGDVVHGTTLVTNALIERTGARLGLITTRGFRDILEMGTEQRYDIYDLFLRFPDPLVPRRHRLEVAERIDRDGNVLMPLDPGRGARHGAAPDMPKGSRRSPSASCTPTAIRRTSSRPRQSFARHSPTSPSPSPPRWWPSCGSTSAATPPAPTPTCSR